jgi:hypothetical protein
MAKFTVHLSTTASTTVEVEADSAEEAAEAAYLADLPRLNATISNLDLSDVWDVDEVTDEDGNNVTTMPRGG